MTAFLFTVFCAIFVFSARRIVKIKHVIRHDRVLFPFNQLQREIMDFLRKRMFEKSNALSRGEYACARALSAAIDEVVSDYHNTTAAFNLRKTEKHLRAYREIVAPLPEISGNPELIKFYKRFRALLAKSFLAYTPLIRSELALRAIARAARLGYQLGAKERERRLAEAKTNYVLKNAPKVRADWRRYGAAESAAAV